MRDSRAQLLGLTRLCELVFGGQALFEGDFTQDNFNHTSVARS